MLTLILALLAGLDARAEWKNSSEASVVISQGNSRSQNTSARQTSKYSWEKNALTLKGVFLQSKKSGVLSAKQWSLSLRYDRGISGDWSLFLAQGIDSDRFAGFIRRYDSDLGARYQFLKREKVWDGAAEGGYRYSVEHRLAGGKAVRNQSRLFAELTRFLSETASLRLWAEYLPNFTVSEDWMLNSELSVKAALNSVFSVKSAYEVRYDNLPAPGAVTRTDLLFTTSLIAEF